MLNMERSGIVLRRIVMLAFVAIFVVGCGASNTPATPVPIANTSAEQDSSVLLTVAVPSFLNGSFSPSLISAFESTHPGVKVSLVKVDAVIPPAAAGMDKHLAAVQQYVGAADVLYIASAPYFNNTSSISTEATRAGYFLNLKPLVDADTELN